MAKITIFNNQHSQVGLLYFLFSQEALDDYIYVDNGPYAFTFRLNKVPIIDETGNQVARLACGGDGKEYWGNVFRDKRNHQHLGSIQKGYAEIPAGPGIFQKIGYMNHEVLLDARGEKIGSVSMDWTPEDEDYYRWAMQSYVDQVAKNKQVTELMELFRPSLNQTIYDLAGCGALIAKLFEPRRGFFRLLR